MAFVISTATERWLYCWECETLAGKLPPPFSRAEMLGSVMHTFVDPDVPQQGQAAGHQEPSVWQGCAVLTLFLTILVHFVAATKPLLKPS